MGIKLSSKDLAEKDIPAKQEEKPPSRNEHGSLQKD